MQLMDVTLDLLNATRTWQEDSLLSDLFIRRASYSSYKLNSLVYTETVDSAFRALWLATYWISEYPAPFTDSSPIPPSERRQTRVSFEQLKMPSRFAAVTNEEISPLIKQAVPEIHEEGNEVRGGSFNR